LLSGVLYFPAEIRINPNHWNAHYNRGLILGENGRLQEAIAHYTAALDVQPNLAGVRNVPERAIQPERQKGRQ